MKNSFVTGMLLGAFLAAGAFFTRDHYAPLAHPTPTPPHKKGDNDSAAGWLLPADFTVSRFYGDDAFHVLEAPDSVTVHSAGPGSIRLYNITFSDKGFTPDPKDAKNLADTFLSPNTYTGASACAFNPGILVRFVRGDHHLDLLVCFQCEDTMWILDGREEIPRSGPEAGLSDIGIDSLRSICHKLFPENGVFSSP